MTMPGGVPSVTPAEASEAAAAGALIVDVREPDEFVTERIDGVALVPLSAFRERFAELPKDRALLMLCHTGVRSSSATMFLRQNGWTDVQNVDGGMVAWRQAGLPIRGGTPDPGEGDLPG
jgi:rhodanese-related sulfurtransferase